MIKLLAALIKLGLCIGTLIFSGMLIFTPNPSIHAIAILVGLIGTLVTLNTFVIDAQSVAEGLKKELRLVQFQSLILDEVKRNNNQVVNLVTSQADLLTKMTSLAVKGAGTQHFRETEKH